MFYFFQYKILRIIDKHNFSSKIALINIVKKTISSIIVKILISLTINKNLIFLIIVENLISFNCFTIFDC